MAFTGEWVGPLDSHMNVLEHPGPHFPRVFLGCKWVWDTWVGSSQHLKRVIITMVSKSPKWGWFPFQMTFSWLIHEGDPNYLH